jgi:aryl-alcohol dehydrogenase-like predicted oxidoreductase
MEFSQPGKSGLRISRIGIGCMSLPVEEKQFGKIIRQAVDLGINYFDTADIYNDGINEILLGKALHDHRKDVIIASKVGNVRRKGGGLDWNASKKHILSSIDKTLSRLGTDYLDIYQLHGGMITDPIDETIEAFEELRLRGKIRQYGLSSIRPNVIWKYIERSSIVTNMMQYSLLDRRPEEECLQWLQNANVGVLARGSIAQGLLVSKPAKPYLDHNARTVQDAAQAVRDLAKRDRKALHVALQFVLSHPAVTSAIVGIRTLDQLSEVGEVFSVPGLDNSELSFLRNAVPALSYKEHRR